jgi:hypothetical protein
MIEMMTLTTVDWHTENQQHLLAALARVRAALEMAIEPTAPVREVEEMAWLPDEPPALAIVEDAFGLSPFERDVLLLCAGIELDSRFAGLCAAAHEAPDRPYPTFGLALAALPGAHWSALTPGAPLRHWRLIEVGDGPSLTTSPLRLDERVLHHLTGTPHLDPWLAPFLTSPPAPMPLPPAREAAVSWLLDVWSETGARDVPAIALSGGSVSARRQVAATACARRGLGLWLTEAALLPAAAADLDVWLRRWEREAALGPAVLLIECAAGAPAHDDVVRRAIEGTGAPVIIGGWDRPAGERPVVTIPLRPLAGEEQRMVWDSALGERAASLNGEIDALVAQFTLDATAIRDAAASALLSGGDDLGRRLWAACRFQARPHLDGLARRVEPVATWDDLVLPPAQTETLREIAVQVRRRATVYERWGWAARGDRGLGITALFAGASGTGKTLAAEVLANELGLDLYVIDLSRVVDKYIGETEKNLARVFDAAEAGGAVLLFDEADALFGKRS